MRLDEDTLIQQLKMFAQTGTSPSSPSVRRKPAAPSVTGVEMLAAETALGFALPPLLRRLYLEISDGDVGPGLLSLYNDRFASKRSPIGSLVNHYLEWHSATQEEIDAVWGDTDNEDRPMPCPEKLLTVHDWGCNIYSHLDCSRPECLVLRNDNNISFRTFAVEAPSLHQWLEDWLDGKDISWLDWDHTEKVIF